MHVALTQVKNKESQSTDIVIIDRPIGGIDSDVEKDINEEHATDGLPEEVQSKLIFIQRHKDSGNDAVKKDFNES